MLEKKEEEKKKSKKSGDCVGSDTDTWRLKLSRCLDSETASQEGNSFFQDEPGMVSQ